MRGARRNISSTPQNTQQQRRLPRRRCRHQLHRRNIDDKGRADVRAEEAPEVRQQGGAGRALLPLLLLLVPREMHQVHQQERLHPGTIPSARGAAATRVRAKHVSAVVMRGSTAITIIPVAKPGCTWKR